MKTGAILKIVNPILAVVFIFQIITGLMHGIIPHEVHETLHGGGASVLILCVIVHVILNWNWVRANFLTSGKNKG
jgi:hypothetical protein